jgi:hypothetical protein
MNRPGNQNLSTACSTYFQCYPTVAAVKDLLDDSPDFRSPIPRFPRGLRVMGAVAEGATAILCVVRAGDNVEVAIPIPYLAVGQYLDLACRSLIPHTVTTPLSSSPEDAQVTVSGTPTAQTEIELTITDPGDGLDPDTVEFTLTVDDVEIGTALSPTDGVFTDASLNGLSITFPAGDYTDNSTIEITAFVTTATNVMVQW